MNIAATNSASRYLNQNLIRARSGSRDIRDFQVPVLGKQQSLHGIVDENTFLLF